MIRLDLNGDELEVTPEVRLGDAWAAYQAAVKGAGARNVRDAGGRWRTVAPAGAAGRVEEALRHVGLEVSIGPGLAAARDADAGWGDLLAEGSSSGWIEELEEAAGMRLFPFQRDGARWLAGRTRALLLDEMGLGKTVQALAALPEGARALVVAAAAVKAVWAREAGRFRPELEVTVLRGRGSFRWPEPGELVVTSFEILPREATETEPGEAPPAGVVLVADEAHAFKNYWADRTRRFRALAHRVRAAGGRVWLLTGTPLTNRPPDLWGVLQAAGLAEATFGTFRHFAQLLGGYQERVARNVVAWQWGRVPDPGKVAGILRAVSMRRHKADVLPELPPKRREVLTETEIGQRDRRALDRVHLAMSEDPRLYDSSRRVLPSFEGMSEVRATLARIKAPLLESIVDAAGEAGEPLVVFSAHRAPMLELGRRDGWASVTGELETTRRQEVVDAFQRGELLGLACTIAAAGVGLTMTRASRVVFLDLDWSPALNQQAEDRLHRIGQREAVLVTVLAVDHPLEHRILELCGWKEELFASTVGASARWEARVESAEDAARRKAEREARRPRPPANELERWAARALAILSGLDPDGARELNGAGWNKIDGPFGHRLAARLAVGLSDAQWGAAVRVCWKYRRQVRAPPEVAP